MELTALRQFVVIAEMGHLTRAAERLGVTQPALSAMVKKLELEVGASLLDRTGKGVALTEAGRVFLEHAEASVRRADEAVASVRELVGLEAGSIRVGGGATVVAHLLPGVVSEVRHEHPALRFYVREAGSLSVAEAVISGELDLGIVTMPMAGVGVGELMTVARFRDELLLIVPPGHGLASQKTFRWRDVDGEPVVAFEAGSAVRAVIDEAAARGGVSLGVVMEVRSLESIQRMVGAGVGIGFVSRLALDRGSAKGLTCRDGRLVRELAVIRRRDRVPSPAAAVFERVLLSRLTGSRSG
ncbi:MAG: LysR family transcriptional regulator [Planctomycetota bacterium]